MTEDIAALFESHVMNTYSRLPLALVRGEGAYVWDSDGVRYLDFVSGLAVTGLGHCHPRLVQALVEQAGRLWHVSNLYYIPAQGELARLLTERSGLDRAFFCNSGAEANEAAIKLARRYHQVLRGEDRYEIITARQSFHGRTLATITATGQAKYQEGLDPLPAGFTYVPLNDIDALRQAIGPQTAAVMLEPIQGEGGVNPCRADYLQAVRKLCDANGVLLIFDEVQTGMGRTGSWFAYQQYEVQPDVLTLAKALGGGFPIGAALATKLAAEALSPGSHASTFGGNPLACAVACEVIKVIEEEDLCRNAALMGRRLAAGLQEIVETKPQVAKEVRGKGLLLGLELQPGIDGVALMHGCRESGLLINCIGGKVLRFLPPLVVSTDQIDEALAGLGRVLDNLT